MARTAPRGRNIAGSDRPAAGIALYPRCAELRLIEALADSPVVLIHGSRQSGKTTLARVVGARFAGGVVLYDGETSAGFGDRLHAVPLRALWETA